MDYDMQAALTQGYTAGQNLRREWGREHAAVYARNHASHTLARIAQDLADVVALTSDNPRTEDPLGILRDMRAGLSAELRMGQRVWSDPDRRAAIRRAIAEATAADVILLAGKGHERTQEIAGVKHPFYDPDEALAALAARGENAAPQAPGGRA